MAIPDAALHAAQESRRGMPEKRRAIAHAAQLVFGREGYTRASLDVIAAEAGVSKRTIYNHYPDKRQLFLSVSIEGAQAVARTVAMIADRHLRKILDIEEDLIAFGVDRARALLSAADHFAIVRTIQAEASRMPPDVLEAWREACPRASHRDIAEHFIRIADRGMLSIEDAEQAANHFTLLTFTNIAEKSFYGAVPISESDITEIVTSGVKTFLLLYGPSR
jgi:AcrR family transcriptional regulator